jgi:hypothetical protein
VVSDRTLGNKGTKTVCAVDFAVLLLLLLLIADCDCCSVFSRDNQCGKACVLNANLFLCLILVVVVIVSFSFRSINLFRRRFRWMRSSQHDGSCFSASCLVGYVK